MKIAFRFVLLIVIGALGFWLWTVLFPSPEKIILKKISRLAATATISAKDSNLIRAARAAKLVSFFARDAQIDLDLAGYPPRTFSGRDEIKESAFAGFANVTALQVQFLDASVRLNPDKQAAEVSCTIEVNGADKKDFGVQEMRLQFKKEDGDWLITRAETVKTLQ